jgi:hypothetical protein
LSRTFQAMDFPLPLGPTIIRPWWRQVIWYNCRTWKMGHKHKYNYQQKIWSIYSSYHVTIEEGVTSLKRCNAHHKYESLLVRAFGSRSHKLRIKRDNSHSN